MTRLIAFLRAINVGGHNVTMEELRKVFGALGFTSVETFIASGNVIFGTRSASVSILQQKIERRLRESLGYEVSTFIRTEAEVAAIARYVPFTASRQRGAAAFAVGFVAEPLAAAAIQTLMTMKTEIDDFHVHGREVYWLCTKGQNESTFSNATFERRLRVRATFRGLNTISRLAAKYGL